MAIWQLSFMIISRNKLDNFPIESISQFTDELIVWKEKEINYDAVKRISEKFLLEPSWTECIEQYGKIDGTCVKLFHYDDGTDNLEVSCRLDIRTLTEKEVITILDFINANDGMILIDEKVYEATFDNIKKIVTTSQAYKFCQNPTEFFDKMANKK